MRSIVLLYVQVGSMRPEALRIFQVEDTPTADLDPDFGENVARFDVSHGV